MSNSNYFLITICTFILFTCKPGESDRSKAPINESGLSISVENFGATTEGEAVLYTLKNSNGVALKITNYGGILTELHVPDRQGNLDDITLGFDSIQSYENEHPYFGALIGRYGNRIANGEFTIDGISYSIPKNNGPNSLHGGINGFHRKLWKAKEINTESSVGLELTMRSADGEEGYPGNLDVTVTYLLNNKNEWSIEYSAITDKKTPINLTQHSYFNLHGAGTGDILDHEIWLNANDFTPVDETLIPTGNIVSVRDTPFDFTTPSKIGERIETEDQQISYGKGYDHNFVLSRQSEMDLELAATVYEANSGRFVEVYTTEPGIQFYCGNFLDGSNIGKGGIAYQHRTGLCLETQHYPDSPNQDNFPNTILAPGEKYQSKTVYRFSVK